MAIRSGVGSGVVEDVPVRLNNRPISSFDTDSPSSLSTPLSVCYVNKSTKESSVTRNFEREEENSERKEREKKPVKESEQRKGKVSTDYLGDQTRQLLHPSH